MAHCATTPVNPESGRNPADATPGRARPELELGSWNLKGAPRRISGGSLPLRNLTTPPLCASLLRSCQCTGKRNFGSAGLCKLHMVPGFLPMTIHNMFRNDRCRQRSARQYGVSSIRYSAAPQDVRVASDSLFSFRSTTGASLPFPARQPPRGGNRRPCWYGPIPLGRFVGASAPARVSRVTGYQLVPSH
jgi:hypothetical protein